MWVSQVSRICLPPWQGPLCSSLEREDPGNEVGDLGLTAGCPQNNGHARLSTTNNPPSIKC